MCDHSGLQRCRHLIDRIALVQDRDSLVYSTGVMKLADFGLSKSLPLNKHAGTHCFLKGCLCTHQHVVVLLHACGNASVRQALRQALRC